MAKANLKNANIKGARMGLRHPIVGSAPEEVAAEKLHVKGKWILTSLDLVASNYGVNAPELASLTLMLRVSGLIGQRVVFRYQPATPMGKKTANDVPEERRFVGKLTETLDPKDPHMKVGTTKIRDVVEDGKVATLIFELASEVMPRVNIDPVSF